MCLNMEILISSSVNSLLKLVQLVKIPDHKSQHPVFLINMLFSVHVCSYKSTCLNSFVHHIRMRIVYSSIDLVIKILANKGIVNPLSAMSNPKMSIVVRPFLKFQLKWKQFFNLLDKRRNKVFQIL